MFWGLCPVTDKSVTPRDIYQQKKLVGTVEGNVKARRRFVDADVARA